MTYLFETGVVCVPSDDGDAEVAGQLEEVLGRGGVTAEALVRRGVDDGRDIHRKEGLAERVQDVWERDRETW